MLQTFRKSNITSAVDKRRRSSRGQVDFSTSYRKFLHKLKSKSITKCNEKLYQRENYFVSNISKIHKSGL